MDTARLGCISRQPDTKAKKERPAELCSGQSYLTRGAELCGSPCPCRTGLSAQEGWQLHRYKTPDALRTEIVAFDRAANLSPVNMNCSMAPRIPKISEETYARSRPSVNPGNAPQKESPQVPCHPRSSEGRHHLPIIITHQKWRTTMYQHCWNKNPEVQPQI